MEAQEVEYVSDRNFNLMDDNQDDDIADVIDMLNILVSKGKITRRKKWQIAALLLGL